MVDWEPDLNFAISFQVAISLASLMRSGLKTFQRNWILKLMIACYCNLLGEWTSNGIVLVLYWINLVRLDWTCKRAARMVCSWNFGDHWSWIQSLRRSKSWSWNESLAFQAVQFKYNRTTTIKARPQVVSQVDEPTCSPTNVIDCLMSYPGNVLKLNIPHSTFHLLVSKSCSRLTSSYAISGFSFILTRPRTRTHQTSNLFATSRLTLNFSSLGKETLLNHQSKELSIYWLFRKTLFSISSVFSPIFISIFLFTSFSCILMRLHCNRWPEWSESKPEVLSKTRTRTRKWVCCFGWSCERRFLNSTRMP